MKRIFIVNPIAGHGKALKISKYIEEICKELNYNYQLIYTKDTNDAYKISNSIKELDTIIYSVGGDGTLSEVVSGIRKNNTLLGVIPAGSGNDFYRSLNKMEENIVSVDLGTVNDKTFINSASIGLDADIAYYANELKNNTKTPTSLVYYLSILKNCLKYEPYLKREDMITKSITLLAVANGTYYGGGIPIAPNAILNDGLLNIIEAEALHKTQIPKLFLDLLKEKHLESEYVKEHLDTSLILDTLIPLKCNVDGEIFESNHFEFGIERKAIDIYNIDDLHIKKFIKRNIK